MLTGLSQTITEIKIKFLTTQFNDILIIQHRTYLYINIYPCDEKSYTNRI
jgi:hypothetical protein